MPAHTEVPHSPHPSPTGSWYRRLPPLLGTGVLVLTAMPWMHRPVEVPDVSGNLQSTYTLWGMLSTVNHSFFGLLVLAIVLILLFVVSAVLPTESLTARAVAAWFGVGAIVGIVINIDSDYSPSAGIILALVLTIACAAVLTAAAILDMRRRTLKA